MAICGKPIFDMKAQKKNTRYQDGFKDGDDVPNWFWEIVLDEFDIDAQRKLLAFATGADRAGPKGLGAPESLLTISSAGPDSDRLPSAHTCFNHILIPKYKTKEKLGRLLRIAIENAQGFGMM